MSLETDLVTQANGHAGLTALISGRIHPNRLPDNPTVPAVAYQRIGTVPEIGQTDVATTTQRFQLTAWADTYLAAISVAAQVHAAFDMQTFGQVAQAVPDGERDVYQPDGLLHGRSVDFLFHRNDFT